jgi:YidC/Oxa1 family membrane protein insertase
MEQSRVWLAIFLSLGLFFVYDYVVMRPYRAGFEGTPTMSTLVLPNSVPPIESPEVAPPPALSPAGAPVVVETDLFRATIDSLGGRLRHFELKRYRSSVSEDSPGLELISATQTSVLPLTLEIASRGTDVSTQYITNQTSLVLAGDEVGSIVFDGQLAGGLPIRKEFTFSGSSYAFNLDVKLPATSAPTTVGVVMTPLRSDVPVSATTDKALAFSGGKLIEKAIDKISVETSKVEDTLWAGYVNHYFVSLVVSELGPKTAVMGPLDGIPIVRIAEDTQEGIAKYKVLIGPKEPDVLGAAGNHLDRALDFGWFWFIALPLLYLLRFFDGIFGNYGVSIIVLTVLVKIATIPLTRAQYRSMQKMQQIQPHLERMRERFKDDSAGMQREMMEVYKKHGVNPFSGCVPMLLQIPIFVGLYNALMNAIELRHAPFIGWITDLSAPDRLMVGGIGIPVLVIVMGASMLVQQWMTPMQGDPTQRRMMMFMPVIFTAMFLNFPSGLVLYWLVNNVISISQQYVVLRGGKQGAQT